MLKRSISLFLCLVLLLPVLSQVGATDKGQTRASTAFVGYPSVFITEDNYHISFLTNANGMAWVEIGGVAYEDTTAGLMDWETKLHGITVPQSVLNTAKSYTICFQPLSARPAYDPAPGAKQSKTYSFNPVLPGEDPVLLCVSDQHNDNAPSVAVAKYAAYDAVVFGGDYTGHISTEAIANNFLKYSGDISKGTRPVIYPRGNHEIRGQYSHWIDGVMPTSETDKSYYEFVMGDIYGIVLDCGGSYTDDYTDIAGTIDFEPYRVEQTRWLEKVYAKGTWKQYSKRVVFSHVPFVTSSSFTDVYKAWTDILNRMEMSLLVSGHTHAFTMYGTTHGSMKTAPNFPAFTMTATKQDQGLYTGTYLTLGDQSFTIKNVDAATLAVKATHTVANQTYGITTEPITEFVTAQAVLPAPVVAAGTASVPAVSSPYSAHPTVFMVEDNYEIAFLTTETGMAWVEIGGVKYKDSTMGIMDWESRIHKITVPQSVLNRAKKYKICFQSMSERKAYTPVHGSTVSRTYPFTPPPAVPTFLCMSEQLNDNTNAMKVATYKSFDVFVCGGKYMKAANTENNRYYLLTLCGETTKGTKPTIFTRGNRELRGYGAHDVVDSMGTSSTGEAYFYFTMPNVFGIVLDTGEYATDSLASFGGTVRFQKYRQQQTQWLRQLLAEGKWKDYKTRVVICHIPFTAYTDSTMKAVFKEWTDILNQMGITLMIAGHVNNYSYYAPGDSRNVSGPNFPMLTMSDLDNGSYAYSGTYVTFGGKSFTTQNVTNTLAVREKKIVANPLYTEEAELISNYAPTKDEKVLYFGFGNTLEDQQRYSENPAYGGANYDAAGNLRTTNFVKGGGVNFDVPHSGYQSLDNEAGIAQAKVSGPYPTQSSYTGNVTRRFVFGEINDTIASVGSLKYKPGNAEVFQVRFKLDNLKVRTDIDSIDPNARGRIVSLQYFRNGNTSATRNSNTYGGSYITGNYMVVTLDLDNTFKSSDVITKILVEFHGFVKANDSADAFVTLDYVYVGPRATMPTRDEGYLFFGFTDSAAAQYRYASHHYGGVNFDSITNWWDNGDIAAKSIINGDLSFTSKSLTSKSWHYLGTGVGDDDSSKREYPLHHKPAKDDYCEVRLKLDGATPLNGDGLLGFRLEFMPTVGTTDNIVRIAQHFQASRTENGYFTIHFPLGNNASYLAMSEIVRFNALILSVAYGDVITADIDYIYIGSETHMPGSHTYEEAGTAPTCTEAGTIIYTCTLCGHSYEESLAPTGHMEVLDAAYAPTCTNIGLTEGRHCALCGQVFQQQEIIPATGHRYVYTLLDKELHRISCSVCEESAQEPHSFTDGFCICGQEDQKEPMLDSSLKLGHTLNLASDISVNLAVPKSLLEGFDMNTVYVLTGIENYEGNSKTGTTTVKLFPVEQGNYYYFTLNGLTAVQMNDRLRSVLYGTKGGRPYYSATDDYSIADYAYSQMNKASMPGTLKTLCADLLRYGASAQSFKGYRTASLADAKMTDVHKSYLSDAETVQFGNTNRILEDLATPTVSWVGKSLNLESKVTLKFVFSTAAYSGSLEDLKLHVSYTNIEGEAVSTVIDTINAYKPEQQQYAFSFDGLQAAELRSKVSVQIYEGDSPVSCTLEYSADTYGNNKTGALGTLCKALFAYSDSAKAYFVS